LPSFIEVGDDGIAVKANSSAASSMTVRNTGYDVAAVQAKYSGTRRES